MAYCFCPWWQWPNKWQVRGWYLMNGWYCNYFGARCVGSVTIEKMSLEGHTGVLIPKSMSYVDKSK